VASPGLHRHGLNPASKTGGRHSRPGVARTLQTRAQSSERASAHGRKPFPAWRRQDFTDTGPNPASERNMREGAIPGVAVKSWSPGLHSHGPNERAREHTEGSHSRCRDTRGGAFLPGITRTLTTGHWLPRATRDFALPCTSRSCSGSWSALRAPSDNALQVIKKETIKPKLSAKHE
jgi:hypothetical protein